VLRTAVERGDVPGVVAMAANDDGPIYEGAAGVREAGKGNPIMPDSRGCGRPAAERGRACSTRTSGWIPRRA
jgi:hypothetical protein